MRCEDIQNDQSSQDLNAANACGGSRCSRARTLFKVIIVSSEHDVRQIVVHVSLLMMMASWQNMSAVVQGCITIVSSSRHDGLSESVSIKVVVLMRLVDDGSSLVFFWTLVGLLCEQ